VRQDSSLVTEDAESVGDTAMYHYWQPTRTTATTKLVWWQLAYCHRMTPSRSGQGQGQGAGLSG